MKKKKYWYRFTYEECPVCGSGDEYKERVYRKPKPKNVMKRHIYKQVWDYCEL